MGRYSRSSSAGTVARPSLAALRSVSLQFGSLIRHHQVGRSVTLGLYATRLLSHCELGRILHWP